MAAPGPRPILHPFGAARMRGFYITGSSSKSARGCGVSLVPGAASRDIFVTGCVVRDALYAGNGCLAVFQQPKKR